MLIVFIKEGGGGGGLDLGKTCLYNTSTYLNILNKNTAWHHALPPCPSKIMFYLLGSLLVAIRYSLLRALTFSLWTAHRKIRLVMRNRKFY